jgi:A/G-specific adenine glycosylase
MKKNKNLQFAKIIWDHYRLNKRNFLWRTDTSPYTIFVSEIMLQKTQVSRVSLKLPEFLSKFPSVETLAQSTLESVLIQWQGMGYNRRAKFLYESAKIIFEKYDGILPANPEILKTLPGIGVNTAGSISAFAYNIPSIFIETNIRRVYLHYFFPDGSNISDSVLLELIEQTVDKNNPREWYWALMDYGTYLKSIVGNPNTRSKHYAKQSKFEGSNRQVRSKILSIFLENSEINFETLKGCFESNETRLESNIINLQKEGLITLHKNFFVSKR